MASTKYTKSIANDTANGVLSSDGLRHEIEKDNSITKALEAINTSGDVCDVWFKDALPTAEETAFDALFAAHDGVPPPGNPRRASDGAAIVVIEPADVNTTLNAKGFKFTATKSATTDDDQSFAENRELQGVILETVDFVPGDYAELWVVSDPGPSEVVVAKFAETIYIKPSGRTEVVMQTSSVIPAGLTLRLRYVSVGATDDPTVYYDYLTWKQ